MTKPGLLFFANTTATFIKRDIALLERDYNVRVFISKQPKGAIPFLIETCKIILFTLANIHSAKLVLCWFADYHSFWPALIAKHAGKSYYLIEGGYDTVYLPEFDYGVFTNRFRSFCVNYSVRNATLNLPVSNFLKSELQQMYGAKINIEVLPTGYNSQLFFSSVKERTVLAIGAVETQKRFLIKGIDRVLAVASILPDIQFKVIGVASIVSDKYIIPANVEMQAVANEKEIQLHLSKAAVYIQFSRREGLPNIVFEAMLSECVVVGINHSGLGEAIGNNGYLLDTWDVDQAKEVILEALKDQEIGVKSRNYVISNYSEKQRSQSMIKLFEQN